MVVCPACASSRIRHDYRPAPFYLRIFLVRALLCDSCNRQFRAFSLRMPGASKERQKHKADTFLTSPTAKEGGRGDVSAISRRSSSDSPQSVQERELRAQINQRQGVTVESGLRSSEPLFPVSRSTSAEEITCPDCGSTRIKRRPRNFFERLFLSLTEHKAYVCRQCGASFYRRPESR